jgi:hypothetical protein
MDIIGQNGNTGEHYEDTHWADEKIESEAMPNGRWNWYGEGEDQPVWKEDTLEERMIKCKDQNEEARVKMERYSGYNAKFWIFEEKRYATWEESQAFYSEQAKEEARVRATSLIDNLTYEEKLAFRDRLVGGS